MHVHGGLVFVGEACPHGAAALQMRTCFPAKPACVVLCMGACFCKPVVVGCAVTTHCPQYTYTCVLCVLHQSHIASLVPCGQPQHSVLTGTLMVPYYYLTYYTAWMPDCCRSQPYGTERMTLLVG